MTADEVPIDATTTDDAPSRRDHAVARSLNPARARAEKRVQRFLDAATELMNTSDTKDFTVQQVVDRSGQSLRSFYQYFEGKHELLLALFEEAVNQSADDLAELIAGIESPIERLRKFVTEYYWRCTPRQARPGTPKSAKRDGVQTSAIAEFAQQLLTNHPKEAGQAYAPLVDLLLSILDEASADGSIRDDLDNRRVAGVLLQAIMFNTFSASISSLPVRDGDDALLDIVFQGLVPARSATA